MAITSHIESLSAYTIPSNRRASLGDSSLMGQSSTTISPQNSNQPQHATGHHHLSTALPSVCDACPHCDDTCGNADCGRCAVKLMRRRQTCCCITDEREYTMCQVRRHGHESSAWLVAGDYIYDATEYIAKHPGGSTSILKKSGGAADCTEDFHFHSKSGQRLWEKYKVGRVKSCPSHVIQRSERQWWKFWDALGH